MGFKASKFANPADIFMKVLSVSYPMNQEDEKKLEVFNQSYLEKQA